jgi:hypothetical protein
MDSAEADLSAKKPSNESKAKPISIEKLKNLF